MKIALFAPSWPPGDVANGIVTYAAQMVPALRELGHEVFVVTPNKTDNDSHTVDLQSFSRSMSIRDRITSRIDPDAQIWRGTTAAIESAIIHLIRAHNLEVFETEESFGWSLAISRLRLLPVVVRLHGPWFLNGKFDSQQPANLSSRRREIWEGQGIGNAQFVTSPSTQVLAAVKSRYKFSLPNSCVIPNPLDASIREKTWDRQGCDVNNLLFVGRFDSRKGGDLILRVFGRLASSYPELKLTFVGPDAGIRGPDNKLRSFSDFISGMLPETCRQRVEFRGQMTHSELMSLRLKCFATIVASQYEIMPYAVLEAMSLGCPIVATAVGGIPEMIRDQRNGLLVPSQEVGKMTAACDTLLRSSSFAASLGHQAWEDCRDLYGSRNIAEQTVEVYRQAVQAFVPRRMFFGNRR
jgi:glycosyltransferase involved in cell wall biosynthesis